MFVLYLLIFCKIALSFIFWIKFCFYQETFKVQFLPKLIEYTLTFEHQRIAARSKFNLRENC